MRAAVRRSGGRKAAVAPGNRAGKTAARAKRAPATARVGGKGARQQHVGVGMRRRSAYRG